ncbi:Phage protein [Alloactinosynnema sp. L-07]|nr:Phage protein [Alloactinosynnema sp. L-07]
MFFLGTANPRWLADLDVPLCLAYHHLSKRRTLPRARAPWLLDSGAFNRLSTHGGWDTLSPHTYITGVRRLAEEVGNLAFAGQMDWLVGDDQLRRTGLPVDAHLWNTVTNYLDLVERRRSGRLPDHPVTAGANRTRLSPVLGPVRQVRRRPGHTAARRHRVHRLPPGDPRGRRHRDITARPRSAGPARRQGRRVAPLWTPHRLLRHRHLVLQRPPSRATTPDLRRSPRNLFELPHLRPGLAKPPARGHARTDVLV